MRSRIFLKLLLAFIAIIAVATLTFDLTVRRAWEESLYGQIQRSLTEKVNMFAATVVRERGVRPLERVAEEVSATADARATIIDGSGKVLADTRANPNEMENHATRPEFIAALHGRDGSATRTSHTVGIPFLYVAAPIPGGAVRLAYPLSAVQEMRAAVRKQLIIASLLALLMATVLSALVASAISKRLRRIVNFAERITAGDLAARIAEPGSDEISQVAAALDRTARQLESSFAAVENGRQQLEALLNSMQDPVLAVSADRRVQWANGAMENLRKTESGAPLLETFRDPELLAAIEAAISEHAVRTGRATTIVPGRGYAVTAAPLPGGGAVAVLHDVTDVERVEKTRRDFIANVSHELRTPLTSIQGYSETLLDSATDSSTRDFIEIIRKNAARMARLTEDLLILARVESGDREFSFAPLDPAAVLDDAAQSFRDAARSAGVNLNVENAATRAVEADSDALHQVFANLIDNALKYGRGGDAIVIGARDAEDAVEFYVKDFGEGIASDHLPRLFERFYRIDRARSRESGGTGLGLAIAKHIVRAHRGSIRVESEIGHGATFAFSIPAARHPATAMNS